MKALPETFRKSGWGYRLISREGDVAVFEQSKPGIGVAAYEVVIVQRHWGREIGGKVFPPAEHMPSSESWGSLGFTYSGIGGMERAFGKADELQFR